MRTIALLCLLLLVACGGGGGSSGPVDPPIDPPPECCESTAQISQRWSDLYDDVLESYETRKGNREDQYAAKGQWGTAAHFQKFAEDAVTEATSWADTAKSIALEYSPRDSAAIGQMIEDYRTDMLAYMNGSYDELQARASSALNNDGASYYSEYRAQMVNGINAVFDQLQADI